MQILIEKYLEGKASPQEIKEVDAWYNSFHSRPALFTAEEPNLEKVIQKSFEELSNRLGLK